MGPGRKRSVHDAPRCNDGLIYGFVLFGGVYAMELDGAMGFEDQDYNTSSTQLDLVTEGSEMPRRASVISPVSLMPPIDLRLLKPRHCVQ